MNLRKSIYLFRLLVLNATFLVCFLQSFGQLSVGLRGGYSAHSIYLEPDVPSKWKQNYMLPNYGLVLIYNNENNTGLQFEINYAQKGWMEKVKEIEGSSYKRTINYIEVPVFSHFELGKKALRIVIIAGPYAAYKLSDKIDTTNFSQIIENYSYKHYFQKIRDLDFGIKVGGGFRYNITKQIGVFTEFRYDFQIAGGQNIFKDRPNNIQSSRLKEMGGTFGIVWNIIPQKKNIEKAGYIPKEDMIQTNE
jgi:hypothetical protein